MKKPLVLHVKDLYLGLSETFIYGYLSRIEKFRVAFAAQRFENLELFPLRNIHQFSSFDVRPPEPLLTKIRSYLTRREVRSNLTFQDVCERSKPALIHAHFGPFGSFALETARRLRIPLMATFYGYDISALAGLPEWIERYKSLFDYASCIVAISDYMKERLARSGCPHEKLRIVHIGVDLEKFSFSPKVFPLDGPVKVLTVARFAEKKGHRLAALAFKELEQSFANFQWILVGDGPLLEETKDLIGSLSLGDKVQFLGPQPHYRFEELTKECHILLSPSLTAADGDQEGTPTVLMEGQAAGMPVVSTRHSGIPEVVLDGVSGFLTDEGDYHALARTLGKLIESRDRWVEMGRAGRDHVFREFSLDTQAPKLESVYGWVLGSR
jgi:colanic acid/amylovoran biosynthesis glycosyltransferase